jgi:hypothetical protein
LGRTSRLAYSGFKFMTSDTFTGTADSFADPVMAACWKVEQMLEASSPLADILSCLVAAAEMIAGPRAVSSILVLDQSGLLRNGSSPKLPPDYLLAIDRLKPDANVGTCAAAAATGDIVITRSFLEDGKWKELRHLPLSLGFVGAWSMPIKSSEGDKVLGTFGTYYRDNREPTHQEIKAVGALAAAATKVLSKHTTQ